MLFKVYNQLFFITDRLCEQTICNYGYVLLIFLFEFDDKSLQFLDFHVIIQ